MKNQTKQKIRFCPKCKSENVEWNDSRMGAAEGNWVCNDCKFYNIVFPIKNKIEKNN